MYCGQCGTRSPGGIRDGGRRSRRALHAADFTDGVRSCHPVASHGVRCPCQVTGRALPCRARRRDILRMTKSQLIQRIADGQSLLAPRDVELAVKMMLEHMTACLAAGDRPSGILWTLTPPAFGTLAARLTPIACTPPTWRAKKRLRTICWRYRTRLRNPARHVHREHIPTPVEPFELIQHCRIVATARNRPRKVRRQSLNMAPSDVAVAPHPHRARVRPPTRLAPTKWATSASAPSSSAPRTRLRGVLRLPASASASRQACAATGRMCSAPIRVPRRACFGSDRTARTARTDPATARQCAAPDVLYRLTAS